MISDKFKDWLNELNIDFVRWRHVAAAFSAFLVIASWVLFFVQKPNWGIDFTGGTELTVQFDQPVAITEVRDALQELDLSKDSVQQVGRTDQNQYQIRIQDTTWGAQEALDDVLGKLAATYGADWVEHSSHDAEVGIRMSITHKADKPVKPNEILPLLDKYEGASVQAGRDENQLIIQLPDLSHQIEQRIGAALPGKTLKVLSVDSIGPRVGADLRRQAFVAMFATLFLILVYVAFRFELAFAPGAIIALFHDASVTMGFFVLFQKEFSLSLIGALLTIIGYSLNDTIVIYDRMRENREKYRRKSTTDIINLSLNETLTRTVSTSFNTLIAISPFLIMGGAVVQDFAFAMLLGIIFGSYSTIYVASPMILFMEEIQPRLAKLIAVGSKVAEPLDEAISRPLTESEKRRRERAEREKADRGGLPDAGR